MPEIKASPPNWALKTQPLPTYLATDEDAFSGVTSAHWSFVTDDPNPARAPHEYRQVDDGSESSGRPLVFTFPVADGAQDYHFDPASLELAPPGQELFELPASCFVDYDASNAPIMCPQPSSD